MIPTSGVDTPKADGDHSHRPAILATPPGLAGAILLARPMLPCREGCTLVPPPHRSCRTRRQARTRRWPFPRLVCSSESMCSAPSSLPPAPCFFLALPRRRTRGHQIDRFSIFIGRYFSRVVSLLTFSVSPSSSRRIIENFPATRYLRIRLTPSTSHVNIPAS